MQVKLTHDLDLETLKKFADARDDLRRKMGLKPLGYCLDYTGIRNETTEKIAKSKAKTSR